MPSAVIQEKAQALARALTAQPPAPVAQGRAGQGAAFFQLRDYRPGEGAQSIDWRASARRDSLVVREHEREAPRRLYVWEQAVPGMDFAGTPDGETKREAAQVLGLGLSLAAGSAARLPLPQRPLAPAEAALAIGDFWAMPEDLPPVRTGFLLQVVDRAELELPYDGPHLFTQGACSIKLGDPVAARAAYRARISAHCAELEHLARWRGWGYAQHIAGTDPLPAARAICAATLWREGG